MITDAFAVYLHGTLVGGLLRAGKLVEFRFTTQYLEDPSRPVLGLRLEERLESSLFGNDRFPWWFSNLLPEGHLRSLIMSSAGLGRDAAESSLFAAEAQLFSIVGADLPGAVLLVPTEPTELVELIRSTDAQPKPEDLTASVETTTPEAWRFSVAGVRLKFSTALTGGRYTLPSGNGSGDWLVKLPDANYPQLPLNEYVMMDFARRIGIDVPEIHLVHRDEVGIPDDLYWAGEEHAFTIKRFDRTPDGRRVHTEDMAQVRGFYPSQKYNGTFESVGALFHRRYDVNSFDEFVRRLVFNLIIGNADAHLKNWSLIYYDRRIPQISPAYDLVSVAAYPTASLAFDLGLKLAKSRDFKSGTRGNLERLGRKVGLPEGHVATLVQRTVRRADEQLEEAMNQFSATGKMAERFNAHATEVIRRLSTDS